LCVDNDNFVVNLATDGFCTRRGKAMGRGMTDRGVMPRRMSDTGDVNVVDRDARSSLSNCGAIYYLSHANTENFEQ